MASFGGENLILFLTSVHGGSMACLRAGTASLLRILNVLLELIVAEKSVTFEHRQDFDFFRSHAIDDSEVSVD